MAEDIFSIPDVPKKRIGISGTASSPAPGSEPSISSAKSDTESHPTVGTSKSDARARRESTLCRKDVSGKRVTPIVHAANAKFQLCERNSRRELAPFSGNDAEKAYLLYFATGDLHASWHGRKVRLEGGTTHRAQIRLLQDLFGQYAKPIVYAYDSGLGQCSWRIVFDLDRSFEFLIEKAKDVRPHVLNNDRLFYNSLSGFIDAEGHIGLKNSRGKAYPVITVSNRKRMLLYGFLSGLKMRDYAPNLYALRGKSGVIQWQIDLYGDSALNLLRRLGLRHGEKVEARTIVLQHHGRPWSRSGKIYRNFRTKIDSQTEETVAAAARAYERRGERKREKEESFNKKVHATHLLSGQGFAKYEIAEKMHCSVRTVYRRLKRYKLMGNSANE